MPFARPVAARISLGSARFWTRFQRGISDECSVLSYVGGDQTQSPANYAINLKTLSSRRAHTLNLAIQEAARDFRQQWKGMLGIAPDHENKPKPWQTIKALSRRYAEGWDDGFVLRPTSNLVAALSGAISRFLETPIEWRGNPTPEQKRETIDRIKAAVTLQLPKLSNRRLREQPQPVWHEAYSLRGTGSTFERRMRIERIYERWVPVPDSRGDRLVFEFLSEVKEVVMSAVGGVEREVHSAKRRSATAMIDWRVSSDEAGTSSSGLSVIV